MARLLEGTVSAEVAHYMGKDKRVEQARKALLDAEQRVEDLRLKNRRAAVDMAGQPERVSRSRQRKLDLELIAAQEEALNAKKYLRELEDTARELAGEHPQRVAARKTYAEAEYKIEAIRLQVLRQEVYGKDIPE